MKITGSDVAQLDRLRDVGDNKLAEVNGDLVVYDEKSAELLVELQEGRLDPLVYDRAQSDYDQAYQGLINKRNRILIRQAKISSQLAKAVLK